MLTAALIGTTLSTLANADCDGNGTLTRQTWDAPVPIAARPGGATRGGRFVSLDSAPEADLPINVVFTPDGTTAAIVHWVTDNVTFYDVNSRTITHTVGVGDFPTHLAVTPDGQYIVTPNAFSDSISLVDIATHAEVAQIPITGVQPYRVAITPDSHYAIVGVINDAVASSFSVVDLVTRTEVRSFPSSSQGVIGFYGDTESGITGSLFTQFALTPDGSLIVLPNRGGTDVRLYDPATGALVAAIPTAALPTAVDVSSDSTTAVVSHEGSNQRISKLDLPSRTRTGDFALGVSLSEQVIRITPDKSHAMAAISNNVIFVNLTSGAVAATLATGVVGDIEISWNGQWAFVSNATARVIDIASRTIVASLPAAPCVESAASPADGRVVALNSRFREDIHRFTLNGAASTFDGITITGEPPEGDATRVLAISPDGRTLIANNNVSRNVAIIDLPSGNVRAYVDTGDRPMGSAITPDGNYAVIANTDANTVSIIDLATDTRVANLSVSTRPVHVRISPDSQFAYVLSVAGTDMIHFIRLNGAASTVIGTQLSGQTGSAFGYAFTEVSGIELSPDGSILAVCVSFDDQLRLIDTTTRAIIANVIVGDFPIRVAFSPDGTKAYVSNAFSNNLSVVNISGASSSVIATVGLGAMPLTVNPDAAGQYVYCGVTGSTNVGGLRVLSTATNTIVATVPFGGNTGPRDAHLSPVDQVLYVAASSGEWIRVNAAGPTTAIIDRCAMASTPSDMVFSESLRMAAAALPVPDGVDLLGGPPPCPGDLDGSGTVDITDLALFLSQFGSVGPGFDGDLDADGDVDITDLALFLSAFGTVC
ncbi:MAG: beta-propeller fold lactonase family protein [Planctomycetes bacterium]|nr:beta-propeller fold lactonase family protein [Planctomycetota bacterium]